MWLLIDNFDSFTHILHHYLLALEPDVRVYRNDAVSLDQIQALNPSRIIISPGPETPARAGITNAVIAAYFDKVPILGICLGHQALGEFFGATLVKAALPIHGKALPVVHDGTGLFHGIPNGFSAMRYHSLIINNWENAEIQPSAFSESGVLMAFGHRTFACTGIQFHPESVLTQHGMQILRNWDAMCNGKL